MLRNLIVLSDGTEIFSGLGTEHTIQSTTITGCANSGTELTLGSVCSDALEMKLFTPKGNLRITHGHEITLYKVDNEGNRIRVGLFTLEKPERPSRNTYRITAYDRVSWLDRDISEWLKSLDGWPYSLLTFARMVCDQCLLTLVNDDIPNANFPVNKFPVNKMTGRELMGYIGQLAARFCRATPEGDIEFAWYTDSGVTLRPTGERYFNTLKYEDYLVEKIEAVQVQLADGENGLLWPEADERANSYVLSGNPLITAINDSLLPYLKVIHQEIANSIYTPCRITLPASLDIRPGHIVRVVDADENVFETYVMTKTQKGQKDTIESTGNARRDTPTAINDKTHQDYVDAALKRLNQTTIFNKLTNNGAVEGFFLGEDGQIYINATYLSTGILQSKDGSTFFLDLDEGILKMDAAELTIGGKGLADAALNDLSQEGIVDVLTDDGTAKGIVLINGQLYFNASYINTGQLNADLITAGVLKSQKEDVFKLDLKNGTFSMSGTGKFMSKDGKSYVTVDGNNFVLYSRTSQEEYGIFVPIAQIGFTEDSEGVDYPYFLLGNEENLSGKLIGMFKMFDNGFYLGNSVPRYSVGEFKGMKGAAGMFIDISNGKNYLVEGEELKNSFTAVFG